MSEQVHFITTYTGKKFHYLNPYPDEIDIRDIAHALSLTCRFRGHCREMYSVAEHSMRVSNILPDGLKMLGLLHDAAEAYISDIARPLKYDFVIFRQLEDRVEDKILVKFGQDFKNMHLVKEADYRLCATEARDLMPNMDGWESLPDPLSQQIVPVPSWKAERLFLSTFEGLGGKIE